MVELNFSNYGQLTLSTSALVDLIMCVCEKHQNVKLMIDSVCVNKEDKYLLMDKIVCDTSNHAYMLKKCQKCPGSKPLFDFLTNLTSDNQQIKFNQ